MERRVLEWLFAPGAWAVTATLFFFSSLVVYFLPMTADEKFGAIRGVVLVLVVLHYFVAHYEVLLLLSDWPVQKHLPSAWLLYTRQRLSDSPWQVLK